ncbi:hypothetical protein [Amycolatopsis sp. 3B14]|uniref:hypothetical protein n=1 Tax=Amycolatopsis sp. 3B14 TaxID=3243600 RepID=UPI003D999666
MIVVDAHDVVVIENVLSRSTRVEADLLASQALAERFDQDFEQLLSRLDLEE